jgi:serine phosphatase RsbU (regulator of sigma subunit)
LSQATGKDDRKDSTKEPIGERVRNRADDFWQRTTAGLELQELWTRFKEETREGYRVSSREVDWQSIEGKRKTRRVVAVTRSIIEIAMISETIWTLLAASSLLLLIALELADRVSMKRDLEIARDIQGWLVPAAPPLIANLDIAFTTRPANTVAGDYYDAFLREIDTKDADSGQLFLVVADVAGKSVPAAMLMATFQASLRTLAASPISLAELTRRLNHYACAHSLNGRRFTTAFMAELDLTDNSLTYVTAGHNAPVLRRSSGVIERLEAGGVPLGVEEDWAYDLGSTTLGPDDLLVAFSDGVSEAVNEKNEEYGESRLVELVRTAPGESAASSLDRVIRSVDGFVGDTRQLDDITCLVLRRQ